MSGWIKLKRSLVRWEWYDDHNATRLLIHLLCSVNYKDKKWKGILVKAGSLVYSWDSLSSKVFMSVQKCRTAMNKLEKSGEITRTSTSKYQVVTLLKWDKIQVIDDVDNNVNNMPLNKQSTSNQQAINKELTTTKEVKEVKEVKESEELKKKNIIEFDIFWNLYDKKVGSKPKCLKKWISLKDEEKEKIIFSLPKFLKTISEKQFQPHPLTYLNNERWNDELIEYKNKKNEQTDFEKAEQAVNSLLNS